MSGHIGGFGSLKAIAGVLRSHATERSYPFVMEKDDILHIGGDHHITFTQPHQFNSREEQDKFVDDWKREHGVGDV